MHATGVLPEGLSEELRVHPSDNASLYIFEIASSNRGRVYYKVGSTGDVKQRAGNIRSALQTTGRYKGFVVVLKACFNREGRHEAAVLKEIRGIRGAEGYQELKRPKKLHLQKP